ncbi:MAG: MFS transporter [Deltaproteobacteria bacterium]|nr:MFS transporter [Deltaproteobacteria bacterium]
MKKISLLYIAFEAFFSLFLWLPVFYQFQKIIGLSDKQIFDIQSLYYLSFCLFEIPTGWIADRWGYRLSLLLGSSVMVFSNLIPVFAPSFSGMLFHFLTIAAARSLISGAASAYLFEELDRRGARERYKIIEGHGRAWGLVGKILCWPLVGFLMSWHLTLPYIITAAFSALSLFCIVLLPSDYHPSRPISDRPGGSQTSLKACLATLGRSPLLLLLMLQGTLIFVMGRLQITFYQPLLLERSITVTSLGGIMSIITLFEAVGSWGPSWLKRFKRSDLSWLFILSTALALSWLLITASGSSLSIAGFCLFCLLIGLLTPIQKQVVNEAIPDSRFRATLLSLESLLDRLLSAGIIALFGSFTAQGRLNEALIGFSILSLIAFGLMSLSWHRVSGRGTSLSGDSCKRSARPPASHESLE